jgi:hypothetical protein
LPPAPPVVPVETKPIALPTPAEAKPTPAPKAVEPPKPILVPKPSPSAQPAVSGEWATIRGRVVWPRNTALPTPKPIAATADKPHCESQGPLLDTAVLVNPTTRGLKNVVVWLRPDTANRRDPFPKDRINPQLLSAKPRQHVIDQPCCQFVPRVLAAREGDTLVVKNSSPVPHNISFAADDPALVFNVTLPAGQEFKPAAALRSQGSAIPFKCDIHQWMQGRVRVFDHPYFAVTDDNGNFEIPNAPVGQWRLVYWHENGYHKGRAGLLGFPVEVKAGGVTAPTIEYEFPK